MVVRAKDGEAKVDRRAMIGAMAGRVRARLLHWAMASACWLVSRIRVESVRVMIDVMAGCANVARVGRKVGPVSLMGRRRGIVAMRGGRRVVVDRVDYSAQLPLVSTGRLPESIGVWTAFPWSATPGASNYLAALGATLRLNEFLAINAGITTAPDGSPADWIELHNSQSNALSLAGFRFQVNNGPKWTFPAGVQLAADAHLLVWATDRILPGTLNLGQSLSNRGGILSVFWARGRLD